MIHSLANHRTQILTSLAFLAFASLVVSTVSLLGVHKIFEAGQLGHFSPSAAWIFFGSSATGFVIFVLASTYSYCLNKNIKQKTQIKQIEQISIQKVEKIEKEEVVEGLDISSISLQIAEKPSASSQKFLQVATNLSAALDRAHKIINSHVWPDGEADFKAFREETLNFIQKLENLMTELNLDINEIPRYIPLYDPHYKKEWNLFKDRSEEEQKRRYGADHFSNRANLCHSCELLAQNCIKLIRLKLDVDNENLLNRLAEEHKSLFRGTNLGVIKVKDWLGFEFHESTESINYEEIFYRVNNNPYRIDERDKEILFNEYKIHLMPKPEYVYDTFDLLLQLMEQIPALKENINSFKVRCDAKPLPDAQGRFVPVIAIYPKPGKMNAQLILNILTSALKPCFNWGSDIVPRFNRRGQNPLLFYSQGDSFNKIRIEQQYSHNFNLLYDPEGIHYHSKFGNFALKLPNDF